MYEAYSNNQIKMNGTFKAEEICPHDSTNKRGIVLCSYINVWLSAVASLAGGSCEAEMDGITEVG